MNFRAFNEVKATSKAHDKQVSLNTNKNYNALQASKPWASSDDMAAYNRGRGAPRGRGGNQNRGGGGPGNAFFPRNKGFSPGGQQFQGQQRGSNPNRGQFNSPPKFQRNNAQGGQPRGNQHHGNPGPNNTNNNHGFNGGYQQKPRPQDKAFRGGGN